MKKMKLNGNMIKLMLVIFLSVNINNAVKAQAVDNPDSIRKQLNTLIVSKVAADQQLLWGRLKVLAASDKEVEMAISAQYYRRLKNVRTADSILATEMIKFPRGTQARSKEQQAIFDIKGLADIEKAYEAWIKKFPPQSYPAEPRGEDRVGYDYVESYIAGLYAKEKNTAKAIYYAGLLEADYWKGTGYGMIANAFYESGDLNNAAIYAKKALESAGSYTDEKKGNSFTAKYAASTYPGFCGFYAKILYEQKNYIKALKYIDLAIKGAPAPRADFYFCRAHILMGLNQNKEAFENMDAAVKSGKATQEMSDLFKVLYVKVKGSDAGLDAYQADIRQGIIEAIQKRLVKEIVNEPAAAFTLTDLQGNRVSLSDFKGKVVVLDFWATWCGPCKASFPAMQMAVDKYKNDPNVKFLFIHTWEKTATPAADAKAYIESMKYGFQVLMDTKDPETKVNNVVSSYKVNGIPSKFVIDSKGNIRFKLAGFDGSKEAAVDEISTMIDMVKQKS